MTHYIDPVVELDVRVVDGKPILPTQQEINDKFWEALTKGLKSLPREVIEQIAKAKEMEDDSIMPKVVVRTPGEVILRRAE